MYNDVKLTLAIQKDRDNVKAVKKISEKVYSLKSVLSTGKDAKGEWNPSLYFDIHAFTKESKSPTKMNGFVPEPGKKFTVTGSLTATKNGNYTNMVILAKEIEEFVPAISSASESTENEVDTSDPWT